jgi:hypothetical protein
MSLEIINSDIYEEENKIIARYIDKYILGYMHTDNENLLRVVAFGDDLRELTNYMLEREDKERVWENNKRMLSPYMLLEGHESCPSLGGIFIP